ncbi:MAG: hypothetical protein ACPL06_00955 [Candidatus Anstonellales archaeon]
MKKIAALLLVFPLLFSLQLVSPMIKEISENETVYLGKIGPGQTMAVEIYPKVFKGGKFGKGGNYDYAYAWELPFKWKSNPSKIYGNPLQVSLTSPPDAEEGNYTIEIDVEDEGNGELLGVFSFFVVVEITHDNLALSIQPEKQTVGIDQPAVFMITIENKVDSGDIFIISSQGVPGWEFSKPVYVPPRSNKTISYEIVYKEEELFAGKIYAQSQSSSVVRQEAGFVVDVHSDFISDCKATNHGTLVFSPFEGLIYSIAGVIGIFV